MKPIYKFIIIFLILGIIAWIIYFVVSKTGTSKPQQSGENTTSTEQVSSGNEAPQHTTPPEVGVKTDNRKALFTEFKKISDVPALFYWYYKENNRVFYITETGEIKKEIDGKSETIQINQLNNVSVIRPNDDGSFVLLKFIENNGTVWGIFSSMDEKITPLNSSITDAVWDVNNQEIIASILQGGKTSIVSFDSKKNYSGFSVIIPEISLFDVDLLKKSNDELLFIEKFGNNYSTSVWEYNLKTKLFTVIRKDLLDFSLKPTLNTYFFTSKKDGFVIANTSLERIMPVTQKTFPEKCSTIFTTAFCFVPQTEISLFDWLTNSVFSNDVLYKYEINQQAEDLIDTANIIKEPIDAKDVVATASSLFFINKYNNFIYALK